MRIDSVLKFGKKRVINKNIYLTTLPAALESADEEQKVIGCIAN